MSKNKIMVIGSANTDMVVKAGKLPLPGEDKLYFDKMYFRKDIGNDL